MQRKNIWGDQFNGCLLIRKPQFNTNLLPAHKKAALVSLKSCTIICIKKKTLPLEYFLYKGTKFGKKIYISSTVFCEICIQDIALWFVEQDYIKTYYF